MTLTETPDGAVFDLTKLDIHTCYDAIGGFDRDIVVGDYVRHFKGNIYKVIAMATETETGIPYVIYDSMTAKPRKSWAKPYEMFMSEVDHVKYPDVKQRYRFEKVWLSKKITNNSFVSIEYTTDTNVEIIQRIQKFFSRCDISRHERIQVWQAIERPVNMNEFRPTINCIYMDTKVSIRLMQQGVGTQTIVLNTPTVRTTIHTGDIIHFLENRLVLEDRKCMEHDFFEIVPYALD